MKVLLRHWKAYVVPLLILGSLLLVMTACAEKEKPTLKFADTQFESLWINNAVAQFVFEHGYGYRVATTATTQAFSSLVGTNDALGDCVLYELRPAVQAEFVHDSGTVCLHRIGTETEIFGYLLIRLALADQEQHLLGVTKTLEGETIENLLPCPVSCISSRP